MFSFAIFTNLIFFLTLVDFFFSLSIQRTFSYASSLLPSLNNKSSHTFYFICAKSVTFSASFIFLFFLYIKETRFTCFTKSCLLGNLCSSKQCFHYIILYVLPCLSLNLCSASSNFRCSVSFILYFCFIVVASYGFLLF